jgi:hypothetical protein
VRPDAGRICAPPRGDRGSSLIVDVDGVFSERRRFATRARITLTPRTQKTRLKTLLPKKLPSVCAARRTT